MLLCTNIDILSSQQQLPLDIAIRSVTGSSFVRSMRNTTVNERFDTDFPLFDTIPSANIGTRTSICMHRLNEQDRETELESECVFERMSVYENMWHGLAHVIDGMRLN